jgi:DNA-directed RNA polymerase II subunit RPB3
MTKKSKVVSNIKFTEDTITFDLKGPVKDALRLRKIFMCDISTVAFDNIEINANSSVVNDEFLMHRIGLIPIIGNDNYTHAFIECEGPKVVKSDDIQGNIPVIKGIIITKLREGQKLIAKLNTRIGTGEENTKWSAVSVAVYKKIAEDVYSFKVETIGQYCPKTLFKMVMSQFE